MPARPGDIFWISPTKTKGIDSDHRHPHVVIQVHAQNIVNVCALTSKLKRAKDLGNVLLERGEADLSKQSVILVSRMTVMYETQFGEYIGTISEQRIQQVLAGIRFVQSMTRHPYKETLNKKEVVL